MASTKIPSTVPSPQTPNIGATTTEQTGIHYNSIYLQTVPGTIKCVCLVIFIYDHTIDNGSEGYILTFFYFPHSRFSWFSDLFAYSAASTVQWALLSSIARLQWLHSGLRVFYLCCICSMWSMLSTKFHGWKLSFSSVQQQHFFSCWLHRLLPHGELVYSQQLRYVHFHIDSLPKKGYLHFSVSILFTVFRICRHVRLRLRRILEI